MTKLTKLAILCQHPTLNVALLVALTASGLYAQASPTAIQKVLLQGITSSAYVIDNRSTFIRTADVHTCLVTGSGTWTVQLQYSDGTAAGPWTNFAEGSAYVTDASVPPTCQGTGYHPFIRFLTTGTVSITYSGSKNYYPAGSSTGGSGGAPVNATFLLKTANGSLPNAQAMGALATCIVKNTTGTGVQSCAVGTDLPSGIPNASITGLAASATTDTTNATNITSGTLPTAQTPALTGDITKPAASSLTTLATVNSNTGACGDGTHVCQVTLNNKGLTTAATPVTITGAAPTGSAGGALTGSFPNPTLAGLSVNGCVAYHVSGGVLSCTGATWDGASFQMPAGSISAPSLQWPHSGAGKLGFYAVDQYTLGFPDNIIRLVNSGNTAIKMDMSYGNWDIYENIFAGFDLSFRDASTSRVYAILAGAGLTLGPFGSTITTGNSVSYVRKGDNLGGIQNSGGQEVDLQLRKPYLLAVTAPGTPSSNYGWVYLDSTSKTLNIKNDAAVVSHTVQTADCSGSSQLVQKVNADGSVTCATPAVSADTVLAVSPGAGLLHLAGGTQTGTSSAVVTADIANNAVTSAQLSVESTRRTTCIPFGGNDAASVLADSQLGPQSRQYFIPYDGTLVEMEVGGDAGTPNIILGRSRAGSIVNVTSAALATASAGGIACSNVGGTLGIDGATTCSATLQNTAWLKGDWIVAVSGTAGGVAKEMTACLTFVTTN